MTVDRAKMSGDDKCAIAWTITTGALIVTMAVCFGAWAGLTRDLVGNICTISGMRAGENVMNVDGGVDCQLTVDVSIRGCDANYTVEMTATSSCETYNPVGEDAFPLTRGDFVYDDASYTCYMNRNTPCEWDGDVNYNTRVHPLLVISYVLLVAVVVAFVPMMTCLGITRFNICRCNGRKTDISTSTTKYGVDTEMKGNNANNDEVIDISTMSSISVDY